MSDDGTTADAETADVDTVDVTDTDVENGAPAKDDEPGDSGEYGSTAGQPVPGANARRPLAGVRARMGVILLASALIAAAGLAGWLYLNQYRTDQQTDATARKVALDAASSGTIALLSYAPDSLDQDFAAAKARLTGDFLSYYQEFTEQIVKPAAREKSVRTEASVVRAAVSDIHPDSAEVLVFINQTTTSKENPDGAFAASSVKVGLKKIDGAWLIASFDPV
ncbi:MAG: hypothetical protein K0U76_05665 [Actinomycetia bacterium]|nr:hypothetical protein [Actinomycetes bacterium]MCH9700865.1 hypothetical protein [Actinomycetes bacterium]MCH9759559.1 hypothetical protein [Actinomycetes bacterium]